MDGEKKYSPPFGTTHSAGSERVAVWLFGSVPERVRMARSDCCPMMGSNPGVMGLLMGKPVLSAQPVVLVRKLVPMTYFTDSYVLCWMNWKPLTMLLWYAANMSPLVAGVLSSHISFCEEHALTGRTWSCLTSPLLA